MLTRFMIVGAVGTLCLNVGLAGAEPPAAAQALDMVSEWPPLGPESAPMPPGPMPWPRGPMRQGAPGSHVDPDVRQQEWLTHVLGLSAEQKTALGELLEERRSQADALRGQLHEADKKLAAALDAARPVPATVGALLIEQRALMQKLEAAHGQADQALRELLTAEQRAAFESLPKPRSHGRMDRGQAMPPPQAPPGPEPEADDVEP